MMRGASGDEFGNLFGGKNKIGRTAAMLKKPHKATFNLNFNFHKPRRTSLGDSYYITRYTNSNQVRKSCVISYKRDMLVSKRV